MCVCVGVGGWGGAFLYLTYGNADNNLYTESDKTGEEDEKEKEN